MKGFQEAIRAIEKERLNFLNKIDLVQPSFEEQHQLEVECIVQQFPNKFPTVFLGSLKLPAESCPSAARAGEYSRAALCRKHNMLCAYCVCPDTSVGERRSVGAFFETIFWGQRKGGSPSYF